MRRAAVVVLIVVLALTVVAPPAQACVECVALGLASFAVFTQLVSALAGPRVVYVAPTPAPVYWAWAPSQPIVQAPAMSYAAPVAPVAQVAQVAWTGPRVVQYATGRYELRGDGVSVPWVWVWIPTAARPAPVPSWPVHDGPEGSGARTP
jgi:hypothetical protein